MPLLRSTFSFETLGPSVQSFFGALVVTHSKQRRVRFVDAWFQLIQGAQAVAEYRNNQKAIRNVASISYRPSISYLCVLCVSVVKLRR
jgi:hypothetical protein